MNIIELFGHLGADPETRVTPSGQKVTTLRVATTSRRGGKEETTWWRITLWGDEFDKMLVHFKKGSAIIVVGELGKPEIYTDKEGRSQVSLNVTAEFIRFSPFGKTRTGEQSPAGHNIGHAQTFAGGSEGTFPPVGGYSAHSSAALRSDNFEEEETPF